MTPAGDTDPRVAAGCRAAPYPLGAHWNGGGVNFAVFSDRDSASSVCLFDPVSGAKKRRLPLYGPQRRRLARPPARRRDRAWSTGCVPTGPGTRRGACASIRPSCCSTRMRARWSGASTGPTRTARRRTATAATTTRDNAWCAQGACRAEADFDWGDDGRRPSRWTTAVLYEVHVRGFSRLHPALPVGLRGTLWRPGASGAIAHLQRWASPRSTCCRCTRRWTSSAWRRRGCATTGVTTRWLSSAPTRGWPAATTACRRATSSARWCGPCTRPASR